MGLPQATRLCLSSPAEGCAHARAARLSPRRPRTRREWAQREAAPALCPGADASGGGTIFSAAGTDPPRRCCGIRKERYDGTAQLAVLRCSTGRAKRARERLHCRRCAQITIGVVLAMQAQREKLLPVGRRSGTGNVVSSRPRFVHRHLSSAFTSNGPDRHVRETVRGGLSSSAAVGRLPVACGLAGPGSGLRWLSRAAHAAMAAAAPVGLVCVVASQNPAGGLGSVEPFVDTRLGYRFGVRCCRRAASIAHASTLMAAARTAAGCSANAGAGVRRVVSSVDARARRCRSQSCR